jgi:hypothetical protein
MCSACVCAQKRSTEGRAQARGATSSAPRICRAGRRWTPGSPKRAGVAENCEGCAASGRIHIETGVRNVMGSDANLQSLRGARADDSETPCCATQEPTGYAQANEGTRAEGRADRVWPELTDRRRIGSGCDARAQAAADGVGTQDVHARTLEGDRHRAAGSTGDRGCIDGDLGALPEATPSDSTGESSPSPL